METKTPLGKLDLACNWEPTWSSGAVRIAEQIRLVSYIDDPRLLLILKLCSRQWRDVITLSTPTLYDRFIHAQVRNVLEWKGATQGSEEWLAFRANRLTGSDLASILGMNRYQSAGKTFRQKVGIEERFYGNAMTEWGHFYENEAICIYSRRENQRAIGDLPCIPHPTIPWLAASPDFVTRSGRAGEVKCPPRREITNEVPVHYYPQLQLVMEVMDLEWCDFVQYRPAMDGNPMVYCCTSVPRDRQWFAEHLPRMHQFWLDVQEYHKSGKVPKKYEKRQYNQHDDMVVSTSKRQRINDLYESVDFGFDLYNESNETSESNETNNNTIDVDETV